MWMNFGAGAGASKEFKCAQSWPVNSKNHEKSSDQKILEEKSGMNDGALKMVFAFNLPDKGELEEDD